VVNRHYGPGKPPRFTSIARGWRACVLYVPSVNRPKPILRPIGQGWKNSYIKHHRSNGLVNKLRRTIDQSVLQTNHIASLRDYRSNGLVNKLYDHRSNGSTNKPHSIVKRLSVERPGEQIVGPSVKRLYK